MMHFERWKIWTIAGVCLLGALLALPNLLSEATLKSLPAWLPKPRINLGLDLRGGSYLLLEANVDKLKEKWLDTLVADARKQLREAKIQYTGLGKSGDGVKVRITKPEDLGKAVEALRKLVRQTALGPFSTGGGDDLEVKRDEATSSITVVPTVPALNDRIGVGMGTAIETIRKRIDALGTTEPSIQRQGLGRIVVQVPGFDNPEALKETIGKTAALSFHEEDLSKSVADAEGTGVPPGSRIYDYVEDAKGDKILLKVAPVVEGVDLVNANSAFDRNTNEAVVEFRFNTNGALKFGRYTQDNVGRRFAIVLDDKVISAPVIRDAITGGSGQISGTFTTDSANRLAIQLRSGALPTDLTVVDERNIGPGLGADSIRAGTIAAIVGAIGVAGFMMLAYGLFGFFSVLALAVNVVLLFAAMSVLGQTLTLPGIAGIVLTMGMAVDSNVLIYERIREELRSGKTPISAIDAGFSRALVTVIDSHITTLVAGLIMFWLGEGPIRGFAVTLSIGIAISVFTAFTVTRLIIALWLKRQRQVSRNIVVPV